MSFVKSPMHIGRNISKIRDILNIKQEHLADLLKISQQTVSKIEQTEKLSEHIVEKIAAALNIPAGVILNYDDNRLIDFLHDPLVPPSPMQVSLTDYLRLVEKLIELYERLLIEKK